MERTKEENRVKILVSCTFWNNRGLAVEISNGNTIEKISLSDRWPRVAGANCGSTSIKWTATRHFSIVD